MAASSASRGNSGMNAKKKLDKIIKLQEQWCANPANDARKEWDKALRKALADSSPHACAVAATQFWFYATWHGRHGTKALIDGREEGWADVQRALEYRWWHLRLNPKMTQVEEAAAVLGHLIALEDRERAGNVVDFQIARLGDPEAEEMWQHSAFGLFGLSMWSLLTQDPSAGEAVKKSAHAGRLGPYGAVLEQWANADALRDALYRVCDYHVDQVLTPAAYPEFFLSPYDLWAVDYFSIVAVRSALGLTTPAPEHPLLSFPLLSRVPPKVHADLHPDLDRLLQKAKMQALV
jgi:hypothetical protein